MGDLTEEKLEWLMRQRELTRRPNTLRPVRLTPYSPPKNLKRPTEKAQKALEAVRIRERVSLGFSPHALSSRDLDKRRMEEKRRARKTRRIKHEESKRKRRLIR